MGADILMDGGYGFGDLFPPFRGRERGSVRRSRLRCRALYPRAVSQAVLPIDDDLLAGGKALRHYGNAVLSCGDINGSTLDRVVGLDDIHVRTVRPILDRLGPHGLDTAAHLQHYPHIDQLT